MNDDMRDVVNFGLQKDGEELFILPISPHPYYNLIGSEITDTATKINL